MSQTLYKNIPITDAGAEGYGIAKINGKVIFVENAVPGDIGDIEIYKNKKSYSYAKILQLKTPSPDRVTPFCEHFGPCGGCKWQNLSYEKQLFYKQKQVQEQFEHIGGLTFPEILPILPSPFQTFYRNKMEYTFSHRRWLTEEEWRMRVQIKEGDLLVCEDTNEGDMKPVCEDTNGGDKDTNGGDKPVCDDTNEGVQELPALGFHLPGRFDQVLDIKQCHLQADPSNQIRNAVKEFAIKNKYDFFDLRRQSGLLRNLLIRISGMGEIMVIVQFFYEDVQKRVALLEFIKNKFPEIHSLQYIINSKPNETFFDQEVIVFSGSDCIYEVISGIRFKIKPKTFFQTNIHQAQKLIKTGIDFCEFKGDETVYDLYTGTGAIALLASAKVKKVIGIESVEDSVKSADENARINHIYNVKFITGAMEKVLSKSIFEEYGKPDLIITDPPRNGMSQGVITQILNASPPKIVYVSCNPATQARDLKMLCSAYKIEKIQPVDMFPHTQHVENVVLLYLSETGLRNIS